MNDEVVRSWSKPTGTRSGGRGTKCKQCTVLTSSFLDCFFLVSDSGVETVDITSCRRGEP